MSDTIDHELAALAALVDSMSGRLIAVRKMLDTPPADGPPQSHRLADGTVCYRTRQVDRVRVGDWVRVSGAWRRVDVVTLAESSTMLGWPDGSKWFLNTTIRVSHPAATEADVF